MALDSGRSEKKQQPLLRPPLPRFGAVTFVDRTTLWNLKTSFNLRLLKWDDDSGFSAPHANSPSFREANFSPKWVGKKALKDLRNTAQTKMRSVLLIGVVSPSTPAQHSVAALLLELGSRLPPFEQALRPSMFNSRLR
jgi:hypothetical protein